MEQIYIEYKKKNKNGTIRLTCTDERCNASVTMYEDKIKCMRGIHRHQERILPYHIGEMVHEFRQVATTDLRTPLPQIYDHLAKQFVCFFLFKYLKKILFDDREKNTVQQLKFQCFNN